MQYYRHFIQTDASHSIYTTEIIIEKILGSTNICQAASVDDLARCLLKDSLRILLKPIRDLCNISMKLGRFPDSCKTAKLKPLFKKGFKTSFFNYRPILLLTLISKIIGKLIDEQTSSFLSNNEILYNYQSAFPKIHSTDSFLCFFIIKFWKVFNKGLMTGMILIDLQIAFDTIDHDIPLKNLSAIGFPNHTIGWFKLYLKNRFFRVNLENCYSDFSNITYEHHKGPFWCLYCFSYTWMTCSRLLNQIYFYMLKTLAFFQEKDVLETENNKTKILQTSVNGLWIIDFSEGKTKSIPFSSKRKIKKVPKLRINYKNIQIKQRSKVTYLDCILDETIWGESMALKTINKINSGLKFLHRKSKFLTPVLCSLLRNFPI